MKTVFSVMLLSILVVFNTQRAQAGANDGRLDIYWVDVEGGAATLIVTPQGESILIDTGNPGIRDPQRIFNVVTREARLTKIDHLITTHYHRDHYGGASQLSKMISLGTVWDNGKFEDMPDDPGEDYFTFKAEARRVINPGAELPLKQTAKDARNRQTPLSFTCLGTRKKFIPAPRRANVNKAICQDSRAKDRDGSDNANSVAMLLEFGDFRFYDGGDITWNQEAKLICPINLIGRVDVYQVTHHGLDSSNNPLVLRSVLPTVTVMNNGVTKGCAPEVFATLTSTPSIQAMYQVHKNMRPDGQVNNAPDEFIANRKADACEANFIKLSVAPSGKSYEVLILANEHRATYNTVKK